MTTAATYSIAAGAGFVSSLMEAPGFTVLCCQPDFMHVVCLGILQCVQACCLWECFQCLGGSFSSSTKTCGRLLAMLKAMARDLDAVLPISDLTVGMFRADASKSPKFKAKAAEGRYCLRCMLHPAGVRT